MLAADEKHVTSGLPDTGPSEVLPFLYLGSQEDALSTESMQENRITHVINVSLTGERVTFLDENDSEHFLRVPIHDSPTAQLSPYFECAYEFIEKARLSHGRVFIHCLAGISRSPALAIAYVMRYSNLSADDAYLYVKDRRSHISPNFNFLGQLSEYERRLLAQSNSANAVVPVARCIRIQTPFQEHRRVVPVQTCSNAMSSMEGRTKVSSRPTGFDFKLAKACKSERLLSLPSGLASLSIDGPRQQMKLSRPTSMSLRCSQTEPATTNASVSLASSCRIKSAVKSVDVSSLKGKTDFFDALVQEPSMASALAQPAKSTGQLDSNNPTPRNVSKSTCELLVS